MPAGQGKGFKESHCTSLGPITGAGYAGKTQTASKGVNVSGTNPDPEDDKITGLEPGGGVPPGETPPGEGSVAGTQEPRQPGSGRGQQIFWLGAIGAGVLLFLLYFIGYIVGFFD